MLVTTQHSNQTKANQTLTGLQPGLVRTVSLVDGLEWASFLQMNPYLFLQFSSAHLPSYKKNMHFNEPLYLLICVYSSQNYW